MKPTTITNDASLQQAISNLERQKQLQKIELSAHWETTKESLNPLSLFKNGMSEAFSSPDVLSGLFRGIISLGAGFVTRKLVLGENPGGLRKVVGTVAQTGVTSVAFKKSEGLKEKGAPLLSRFLKKLKFNS